MSLGAILGGVGVLGGLLGNQSAERAQNRALDNQERLARLTEDNYHSLTDWVNKLFQSGQLDPTRQLNLNKANLDAFAKQYETNAVGTLENAGYQPGDTKIQSALQQGQAGYSRQFANDQSNIRNNALQLGLQARMAPTTALGPVNASQGVYGNMYNAAGSKMQDIGSILGGLSKYFPQKPGLA